MDAGRAGGAAASNTVDDAGRARGAAASHSFDPLALSALALTEWLRQRENGVSDETSGILRELRVEIDKVLAPPALTEEPAETQSQTGELLEAPPASARKRRRSASPRGGDAPRRGQLALERHEYGATYPAPDDHDAGDPVAVFRPTETVNASGAIETFLSQVVTEASDGGRPIFDVRCFDGDEGPWGEPAVFGGDDVATFMMGAPHRGTGYVVGYIGSQDLVTSMGAFYKGTPGGRVDNEPRWPPPGHMGKNLARDMQFFYSIGETDSQRARVPSSWRLSTRFVAAGRTHRDETCSILVVLEGKKTVCLWRTCAPRDPSSTSAEHDQSEQTDDPDLKLDLEAGDALYIPKRVWHRITSVPKTLAFSLKVGQPRRRYRSTG